MSTPRQHSSSVALSAGSADRAGQALVSQRTALLGAAINILLVIGKLAAGIFGHSHALIADAVESLTDLAGSVIVWGGLKIGARPPDSTHPYGHGKAEGIAVLAVAALLIAAAVWIAVEAVHQIKTPHSTPAPFTLLVLVGVVVVKELLFRVIHRVGDRADSGAVRADAWHHRADAITSLAAFIGISVSLAGARFGSPRVQWETADDWAALFASAIILYNALNLVKIALRELMDAADPADLQRVIEPASRIALSVPGVRAVEKTLARKSGAAYHLDMHVQVDPQMPVAEAHAVGGRVRAAVRTGLANVRDVLIHIEPYTDSPTGR